ncbi:hypothetical protein HF086_018133 [Spodoptera exigua]|uniref:Uncharacterized protein n=1 Tax=Spodoptera exigua TaxID=7107 RepID=A0A922MPK7_SPOEX|nr:hypothetical protein HF086_018133 [Spodoptera exigua]
MLFLLKNLHLSFRSVGLWQNVNFTLQDMSGKDLGNWHVKDFKLAPSSSKPTTDATGKVTKSLRQKVLKNTAARSIQSEKAARPSEPPQASKAALEPDATDSEVSTHRPTITIPETPVTKTESEDRSRISETIIDWEQCGISPLARSSRTRRAHWHHRRVRSTAPSESLCCTGHPEGVQAWRWTWPQERQTTFSRKARRRWKRQAT